MKTNNLKVNDLTEILEYQYIPTQEELQLIKQIYDKDGSDPLWACAGIYSIGIIVGKRIERLRRKESELMNGK